MRTPAITISQEEAIHEFRDQVMPFLDAKAANVGELLNIFLKFYRETRIEGAALDEDGDMLLLEWGSACPHLIKGFKDFRTAEDDDVDFAEEEYQWLGLTRQVFTGSRDPEVEEFDEEAVGLCISMYFGLAKGNEPGDNIWVPTPAALPAKLKEFNKVAYVAKLLKSKPSKITAFISSIG